MNGPPEQVFISEIVQRPVKGATSQSLCQGRFNKRMYFYNESSDV